MNQMSVAGQPGHEIHLFGRASAMWDGIRTSWARWSAQRRERAALLALSDAELKDIGVSRAQALFEFNRL